MKDVLKRAVDLDKKFCDYLQNIELDKMSGEDRDKFTLIFNLRTQNITNINQLNLYSIKDGNKTLKVQK